MKEVELDIETFSDKGFGIAYILKESGRKKVEVPHAFKDERVKVILKKRGRQGRLLNVIRPSSERTEPRCQHTKMCGGCVWQEMDYKSQLSNKEFSIQKCFQQFLSKEGTEFFPIIASEPFWHYRNKMEFSFSENAGGDKYLGLMIMGAPGYVFNVEKCHLAKPWFSDVLQNVRTWWQNSSLPAYHFRKGIGLLRTLTIREGMNTGEKMVFLTVSAKEAFSEEQKNTFLKAVQSVCSEIQILIRYQKTQKGTPTTFDQEKIYGKDFILEKLSIQKKDLYFQISPTSFFQPNTSMAQILYQKAFECLNLDSCDLIYDLYSGTGTLGMVASQFVNHVIGIELNCDAVSDAQKNIELNGIKNFTMLQGDVGQVITSLMAKKDFKEPDVVIVDPPRVGLDALAIHHLKTLKPQVILYISCNPITQAQNIEEITSFGYQLKKIQPIDQFPHTVHVENIALLIRH